MLRFVAICVVVGLVAVSFGCAMPQMSAAYGGLVTANVKGPVAGVDNSVSPEKQGVAKAQGIIFFATGDASIKAAMEAGGITKVHHVDSDVFSVLGLYTEVKTVVYGE